MRFAMNQDGSQGTLEGVSMAVDPQRNLTRQDAERAVITEVGWFNAARRLAGLP